MITLKEIGESAKAAVLWTAVKVGKLEGRVVKKCTQFKDAIVKKYHEIMHHKKKKDTPPPKMDSKNITIKQESPSNITDQVLTPGSNKPSQKEGIKLKEGPTGTEEKITPLPKKGSQEIQKKEGPPMEEVATNSQVKSKYSKEEKLQLLAKRDSFVKELENEKATILSKQDKIEAELTRGIELLDQKDSTDKLGDVIDRLQKGEEDTNGEMQKILCEDPKALKVLKKVIKCNLIDDMDGETSIEKMGLSEKDFVKQLKNDNSSLVGFLKEFVKKEGKVRVLAEFDKFIGRRMEREQYSYFRGSRNEFRVYMKPIYRDIDTNIGKLKAITDTSDDKVFDQLKNLKREDVIESVDDVKRGARRVCESIKYTAFQKACEKIRVKPDPNGKEIPYQEWVQGFETRINDIISQ